MGTSTKMGATETNPYETAPGKIPASDPFLAKHPSYGRYDPDGDDTNSDSLSFRALESESTGYWEDLLMKCEERTRVNNPTPGRRDTFALGNVLIKSDHLRPESTGDYSLQDENEVSAVQLVERVLPDVELPKFYARMKIRDRDVLVQSRIPGVSLEVAWPYLSVYQREAFKQQARDIAQRIHGIRNENKEPSYVVANLNSEKQRSQEADYQRLFDFDHSSDDEYSLAHNDLVPSNIIVSSDRIVGVVGWSQTGYFGWNTAKDVHREYRCNKPHHPYPECFEFWRDLYDIVPDNSVGLLFDIIRTKQEPEDANQVPISSLVPAQSETNHEIPGLSVGPPTPRKVSDLKRKSMSRASSTDRSSPAPSSKQSVSSSKKGVSRSSTAKKGTSTRKPSTKKRKLNGQDASALEGTSSPNIRSGTPASSRASKTPAARNSRKQSSLSAAGSPAPEKKGSAKGHARGGDESDGSDEDEDPSLVFCICRKPDNHTWMIGCDGGCEDWFHGKCVNISSDDADLIDKYICSACEARRGLHTTWKPMCRLPGCRQPARVTKELLSKYCCDEHGRQFMLQNAKRARNHASARRIAQNSTLGRSHEPSTGASKKHSRTNNHGSEVDGVMTERSEANSNDEYEDDGELEREETEGDGHEIGSRGGVLYRNELKTVVSQVKSAREFRTLGESVLPPPNADADPVAKGSANGPSADIDDSEQGFDETYFNVEARNITFTNKEREQVETLRDRRISLRNQLDLLRDREKFLGLVRQHGKTVLERLRQTDPKNGVSAWKDICGFDSRLSWSDEEFDEWRKSDTGKEAFESGILESIENDSDTEMDGTDDTNIIERISRGVCTRKRCERHKQWHRVQQQDLQYEEAIAKQDLAKCEKETKDLIGRVVMRVYADGDSHEYRQS